MKIRLIIILVISTCHQSSLLKGNEQWLYWHPDDEYFHEDGWIPTRIVTTDEGTTPPGSQWAMINLPTHPGSENKWAWKDLVEVFSNYSWTL